MGADLFASDAHFTELVSVASNALKTDLRKICLRGPDRELTRTEFLQPLMVAVSLGYARKLISERGVEPHIVLGHSLGEISALTVAEALSDEQAVLLAVERGRLMALDAAKSNGGMMAVISNDRARVFDTLSELLKNGTVYLANDNSPVQNLLSGTVADLEEASWRLSAVAGVTCKKLPVAGAWHSPLMQEARDGLARYLETLSFKTPRMPILMNVSAEPETDPERIRALLLRNLTEPARWRSSMERLKTMDANTLFEIGPGRVLSGLARANGFGGEIQIVNVNNLNRLMRV